MFSIVLQSGDTLSSLHLHRVLDHVFQTMVLVAGLDDLVAQRNIDRLKRDLRVRANGINLGFEALRFEVDENIDTIWFIRDSV